MLSTSVTMGKCTTSSSSGTRPPPLLLYPRSSCMTPKKVPTLTRKVLWMLSSALGSSTLAIVSQGRLKKVHGTQLRHASETERDIANANTALTLPWTFTTVVGLLEKGTYDDYTNEKFRGRSASGARTPGRGRSRSRARSVPREGSQAALRQPLSVPRPLENLVVKQPVSL